MASKLRGSSVCVPRHAQGCRCSARVRLFPSPHLPPCLHIFCSLCSGRHPVSQLATSHGGRLPSAPGAQGDEHVRWGAWRPDANIPMQPPPPKTDTKDWRMDEIAKIQRDLEASRREEERLAAETRNNERILLHNTNELRHWRAAIQARDAELVRRHEDDRDRMHKFLIHFKERLDHERAKLRDVSAECFLVLRLCRACIDWYICLLLKRGRTEQSGSADR